MGVIFYYDSCPQTAAVKARVQTGRADAAWLNAMLLNKVKSGWLSGWFSTTREEKGRNEIWAHKELLWSLFNELKIPLEWGYSLRKK